MGLGVLAPVPSVLIRDALITCAAQGRVAFGSDATEFRSSALAKHRIGTRVLIYISQNTDPKIPGGHATLDGVLIGFAEPNGLGRHKKPQFRPANAIDENDPAYDRQWTFFWEISGLSVTSPFRLADLMTDPLKGKPAKLGKFYVPRGPILVQSPDL